MHIRQERYYSFSVIRAFLKQDLCILIKDLIYGDLYLTSHMIIVEADSVFFKYTCNHYGACDKVFDISIINSSMSNAVKDKYDPRE